MLVALPPRPRRALVGRQAVVRAVQRALTPHRAVAVVGPPGVGKTRLALDVVRGRRGAAWLDLTGARTAADIAAQARQQLRLDGDPRWGNVARDIVEAGVSVLVLDNVEQIRDLDDAVQGLLDGAPSLQLLLTSRVHPTLPAEAVVRLGPLDESDAVDLFYELAAALAPLDPTTDLAEVRALVGVLEGIPLSLELAAARLEILTLSELLERVSERFKLLRDPNLSGRHATAEAALDWSWQLLTPSEQRVLSAISTWEGSFSLVQAEAVAGPGLGETLGRLARHSLLEALPDGRFRLLELLRQYARARLGAEREAVEDRHRDAVMKECEATSTRGWGEGSLVDLQAIWTRSLERAGPRAAEAALRAQMAISLGHSSRYTAAPQLEALARTLAHGRAWTSNPRVRHQLARVHQERGRVQITARDFPAARQDLLSALELAAPDAIAVRSIAMCNLAAVATELGQREESLSWLNQAIEVTGDQQASWALGLRALHWADDGDYDRADRDLVKAISATKSQGKRAGLLLHRAFLLLKACRPEAALTVTREAASLHRNTRDRSLMSELKIVSGSALQLQRDLGGAQAAFQHAARLARETGEETVLAYALLHLGGIYLELGNTVRARPPLVEACALFSNPRNPQGPAWRAQAALLWASLGEENEARALLADFPAGGDNTLANWVPVLIRMLDGEGPEAATDLATAAETSPHHEQRLFAGTVFAWLRTWRVMSDATRLSLPGATEIDLREHPVLARLVATLTPPDPEAGPIAVVDLVRRVWPGERLVAQSGESRIYNAMHTLRGLGLPISSERGRGYWFDAPWVHVAG